ncbi:MAG TPA: nucleotidyltransferase family protein [Patescibacteria group bacterium]|nr:nucleotidyltransferase family protein [Patescibacteria group bacterium]
MNEKDIIDLIKSDKWMMEILEATKSLNLPDWWIGAGFVRGKVWDTLHGYSSRTPLTDIDVIYFDKNDFSEDEAIGESTRQEIVYEDKLNKLIPNVNWSVTNQARMHLYHKTDPYKSSEEALADWVETATCIGIKIGDNQNLILTAPHGIDDLVNLILRPTTKTKENLKEFERRVRDKKWLIKWPKLKVETS